MVNNPMETETEKKDRILGHLAGNHPEFLEEARRIARYCCHKNIGLKRWDMPHTVTSDYLREQMFIERVPDDRHKVMGSVFRKGFVRVGFVKSIAEGCHSRIIGLWTIPRYVPAVKSFNRGAKDG